MPFGTLRCDTIQSDGGTAKTVNDIVVSGGALGAATATTPAASDNDTSVATTAYVKNQLGETAVVTAQRSMTERTIAADAFDLATGNLWTCGAIAVHNPTNGVAGQVGLIRATGIPTDFGNQWDHPGGQFTAPTSVPAIAPFFVISSTQFLLGSWTEGIA